MGRLYVGTMGWSYDFWVGNFYSADIDKTEYLTEYARHFDSVEVDSTFYRIPSEKTVKRWFDQTPSGFLFSTKFPRIITHKKMLIDCQQETNAFLRSLSGLGDKLGPLLLQFPSTFSMKRARSLEDFLMGVPTEYQIAVEVRNKEFLNEEFFSLLKRRSAAFVWVDSEAMSEVEVVTADFVYIRWKGDRRKVNGLLGKVETQRSDDIKAWARKIGQVLNRSLNVFGYFSKYYSGHPPTDAKQLLESIRD